MITLAGKAESKCSIKRLENIVFINTIVCSLFIKKKHRYFPTFTDDSKLFLIQIIIWWSFRKYRKDIFNRTRHNTGNHSAKECDL